MTPLRTPSDTSTYIEIHAQQNYKPSLCKDRARNNADMTFYSAYVSFFGSLKTAYPILLSGWLVGPQELPTTEYQPIRFFFHLEKKPVANTVAKQSRLKWRYYYCLITHYKHFYFSLRGRLFDFWGGWGRGYEWFSPKALGPVPWKMVQFNPGLSQILSKVFLPKNMSLELTNQLCLSMRFSDDNTKSFSKQWRGK